MVRQVDKSRYEGVLGINIGKNLDTPVEKALDDYLICLQKVYSRAGYVVVNISSPNTPGLRNLQYGESLDHLLSHLKEAQQKLATEHGRYVPLVVKIAPDLDEDEVSMIAGQLINNEIEGVIVSNTTLSRSGVEGLPNALEQGGLSGEPLMARSTEVLKQLSAAIAGKLAIIGVGGIMSADDAVCKIEAGASLVQLYTGFIYKGPSLITASARRIAHFQ